MNPVAEPSDSLHPEARPGSLVHEPAEAIGEMAALLNPPLGIVLLAWVIRLTAVINLISSLINSPWRFIEELGPWLPFEIAQGRPVRHLMMALLLFILASALVRGKRTAWLCTIIVLAIAPLLHMGRLTIWPQLLINFGLISFLFLHHRYFVAGSDQRSVRSALIICPLLAIALLIFGSIRLHDLRNETSGDDDWGACVQTAFELVLVHETQTQRPDTKQTRNFFSVLRMGGTSIALIGLLLTLRPVLRRRISRSEDREQVRKLIEAHGRDPLDPYILLHDKNYFLSRDGRSAVAYALAGDLAVALADPIGPREQCAQAIAEFAVFCRRKDWEPVFYEVTGELLSKYEEAGFSLFKIGEEARLRSNDFHLRGNDFQNLRTARNRAHKLGIRFSWYDPGAEPDEALEGQLAHVSQRWLEGKKAREMSFDMGAYSLEDIRHNGAAMALDPDGRVLAFATWRPYAQGSGRCLDLMRTLPKERNLMDFILVESIATFQARGIYDVSLGNAPLANTEGTTFRPVAEERVVQFIFENLNRIYGYKSLFEFKRKYRPKWNGRYVAYRRGARLPLVGLALVRVHAPDGIWKFFFG